MGLAKLLVVEDDASMREVLSDTLTMAGYDVSSAESGEQAMDMINHEQFAMVISDVQMGRMDGHSLLRAIKTRHPALPVLLMTAYGTIPRAIDAIRDGAIDYLIKPFEAEVVISTVGRYVVTEAPGYGQFIAADEKTRDMASLAQKVAITDATVMITGESGVGKEVLARFIHNQSPRAAAPFIAINCAAIPDNMLESTLFGYEKGAFTGAYKACPGKFELAQGGTLLLDEISEMDLGLQAKLLRVLQEKEVERLGGNRLIELDVRVLATSNRNLRNEVQAGKFREDLFYRLNVFPLHLPPLRERQKDILPLAQQFLERTARLGKCTAPVLSPEAIELLTQHGWPGNVRELDNVIQRALIFRQGDVIRGDDLHFENMADTSASPQGAEENIVIPEKESATLDDGLRQHENNLILDTLNKFHGSRKKSADVLNVSPRTLRYKLAKMREEGIQIPGDRDD
ncbi:MAG: sigma-54-dependent Fis family transcriptional regulator [Gammaproteobacteria bacterium RBG_16_57_12]|nr:MAG: sigma-54-dependent Fis family transcriptional regulator [Gammaproteobacteria bacterium RBG_16_57_12]